jgi:predicted PurR-regulated permease PerM
MDDLTRLVPELDPQSPRSLLEVLIRAALIVVLAVLCYQVFAPFLVLMEWALILSVTLYPVHQRLARRLGGRQGWAATVIALLGIVVIVAPTAVLVNSMGESVQRIVQAVQENSLVVPPPRAGIADLPFVGPRIYAAWQAAHTDLPAFVQTLQPQVGNLAKAAIATVAAIGGDILKFVAAYIIAGIVMAFGTGGATASRAIFARMVGE